jgi:hypothetical protein
MRQQLGLGAEPLVKVQLIIYKALCALKTNKLEYRCRERKKKRNCEL